MRQYYAASSRVSAQRTAHYQLAQWPKAVYGLFYRINNKQACEHKRACALSNARKQGAVHEILSIHRPYKPFLVLDTPCMLSIQMLNELEVSALAQETKSIDAFIILSILVLVAVVAVSLGLFFYNFSAGLSANNQDWGAFGSYLSGTVGVTAASIAVIWLIRSVYIQKVELEHVKRQLEKSSDEQEKQTHISALTAMVSTGLKKVEGYGNSLRVIDEGTRHLHPLADEGSLHIQIDEEQRKVDFYQKQIEQYIQNKYEDYVAEDSDEDY